tara:strand:+ start:1051 stop:1470 length:420 start_codon:yes stop_codon:yes gene_type:complete
MGAPKVPVEALRERHTERAEACLQSGSVRSAKPPAFQAAEPFRLPATGGLVRSTLRRARHHDGIPRIGEATANLAIRQCLWEFDHHCFELDRRRISASCAISGSCADLLEELDLRGLFEPTKDGKCAVERWVRLEIHEE